MLGSYYRGLGLAFITSAIGMWLIFRAVTNDTSFMDGTLKVPRWLVFSLGVLMQSLLVIYLYLGIRGGFF